MKGRFHIMLFFVVLCHCNRKERSWPVQKDEEKVKGSVDLMLLFVGLFRCNGKKRNWPHRKKQRRSRVLSLSGCSSFASPSTRKLSRCSHVAG